MTESQFNEVWDRSPNQVYEHLLEEEKARQLLADLGAIDGIDIVEDLKQHFILCDSVDGYTKAAYLLKLQKQFQAAMNEYVG